MLKKVDPVERILLRHKKISEKVLQEVKSNNLHSHNFLGKTLVDHGYIHTQTLLETLSTELRLPYVKKKSIPEIWFACRGSLNIRYFFKRESYPPIATQGRHLNRCSFRPIRPIHY